MRGVHTVRPASIPGAGGDMPDQQWRTPRRSERVCSPTVVALAGLTALAVAMGIGRFAFTPVLPMMQIDAGLSVAAGGWLASVNYVGSLLGALAAMALRVAAPT